MPNESLQLKTPPKKHKGPKLSQSCPLPTMTVIQQLIEKKKRKKNKRKSSLLSADSSCISGTPSKVAKLDTAVSQSPGLGKRRVKSLGDLPSPGSSGAVQPISVANCANSCVSEDAEGDDLSIKKALLLEERKSLPVFSVRWSLVKAVRDNDCVIMMGETGCGKTTQIPQFLHDAGFTKRAMIGVTQPRRVAAVTIANRVAMEMGVNIGDLVGYSVRFDDSTSHGTKIKYLTDGMLLREALSDPLLQRYRVIILDEAHERTVNTDILFGVVKIAQQQRKKMNGSPLKVVVMSATMNVDQFSAYFDNAPVYMLQGRQHPIKSMYAVKKQEDYIFATLVTVFQIHQSGQPGDILVFCTGQEEIESAVKATRETRSQLSPDEQNIVAYPLYSALPSDVQLKVFQPATEGTRKVIFATNIAETSVTIPGIKFVIDTGMVKEKLFHPKIGFEMLKVQKISKAQAWQRAGRAGRECSGICYRLFTRQEFDKMKDFTVPEIQRCSLSGVVLQMLAIGISDIFGFDFMDKPSQHHIVEAMTRLHQFRALEKADTIRLSPLGKKMARFPLEPRFAKIILASQELGCTEEILTIISMLSGDSVLFYSEKNRDRRNETWKKFQSNEGDHITLLNIFRGFKGVKGNKEWCKENFVNRKNMIKVLDIRRQLAALCAQADVPLKSCGKDTAAVRKCMISGLFTNVAELQKEGHYTTVESRKQVYIHPSSSLFSSSPSCIIYTEMVETTKCYMKNLSVVDPDWLLDMEPQYFKSKRLAAHDS
ncbi:ATP-dependent RNA helicase DHX33-like [Ornithodoros turicata]